MKKMKKTIMMLLSALMIISVLSACGKKEAVPEETAKEETKTEEKEETVTEPEDFDPKKLAFKDRFLAGNRNIFYI